MWFPSRYLDHIPNLPPPPLSTTLPYQDDRDEEEETISILAGSSSFDMSSGTLIGTTRKPDIFVIDLVADLRSQTPGQGLRLV
jgi:hypothetical protein